MRSIAVCAVAVLLAAPAAAPALSFESFGNQPLAKGHDRPEGVLGVVNLGSRVYSVFAGEAEQPTFYFRGDVRDLNAALAKFAAVKQRRLVLLPGRGRTHSFDRKAIDYDWRLDVSLSGDRAVLTAYVNAERPGGAIDVKKARKWIGELDSEEFDVRQAASGELAKLGMAAKPLLRETLKSRPGLEVRRRVEALLAKLKGVDADDLDVPDGTEVVTASDLLAEHFKSLKKGEDRATSGLVELAPFSDDVVPALAARLAKGNGEYTRRCAAFSLGRIGAGAKAALPALKNGLDDPDKNVASEFGRAVDQITKAEDEKGWAEEVKKRRAILKDLDGWKKAKAQKLK